MADTTTQQDDSGTAGATLTSIVADLRRILGPAINYVQVTFYARSRRIPAKRIKGRLVFAEPAAEQLKRAVFDNANRKADIAAARKVVA